MIYVPYDIIFDGDQNLNFYFEVFSLVLFPGGGHDIHLDGFSLSVGTRGPRQVSTRDSTIPDPLQV